MRDDWNRRITHDYRFWMSDGVESDEVMWASGQRDFHLLMKDLDPTETRTQTALEIGCGVGRLLRPAASHFAQVVGIDVSNEAIERGRVLLRDLPNVKLICGDGLSLEPIAHSSIDFAFSFAAFSNLPVRVAVRYLIECSRVLRLRGKFSLQLYFGPPQGTTDRDTLAIRTYVPERFRQATERLGLVMLSVDELKLPFETTDSNCEMHARTVLLEKRNETNVTEAELSELLLAGGERVADSSWPGSRTEYLVAVARGHQLIKQGNPFGAEQAYEHALRVYHSPDREIVTLLDKMHAPKLSQENSSTLEENLKLLYERFPTVKSGLERVRLTHARVICGMNGHPVVFYRENPLDHPDKPIEANRVWAERELSNHREFGDALIIAGVASAYHLEALANCFTGELHLVEPNLEILLGTLSARDLRNLLGRITSISTTSEEFEQLLTNRSELRNAPFLVHPTSRAISGRQFDEFRRILVVSRGLEQLRPSIGVVGPIYGGSLPITHYLTSALGAMNQQVYQFDLGEFHSTYRAVTKHVRDRSRVNSLQGNFVELLSQMVLEAVVERNIDIVISLAQAPLSGRVLEELRKRGVITAMWFVEDCRRFTTWRDISRYYDYMFIIQQGEFPQLVEQAGAGKAIYLPVGCDPAVHRPLLLSGEERARWGSAISFVGAGYNNRRHVFATLAGLDFKIWGTEWPNCPPFHKLVQEQGRRLSPEEYIKIFNASTINLNLHSSMERDGVEPHGDFINPRTFELAAAGAFQLVDDREPLGECFVWEQEVATFASEHELEEKIDYYLTHPEVREEITRASRIRALRDHTYRRRAELMLGHIYADHFEHLRLREQQNPWSKILKQSEKEPELHQRFQRVHERGGEPKLDEIVAEIRGGSGALNETELKLLFLHQLQTQVSHVTKLRAGE